METPSEGVMCCTTCQQSKLISEMSANSLKRGKSKQCLACQREYQMAYHTKNRVKTNQYHRDWRARLGDTYREGLVANRKAKIARMTPEELEGFRKREADKSKRLNAILKNEVFMQYGGWECACCGETERSFLTMDHMQNNGSQLRRDGVHGHSTMFYRWLKKNGYPKDFQVLCMNCQFGKRMNNGTCPHPQRVTTSREA